MNTRVIDHIKEYSLSQQWGTTMEDVKETLIEATNIHREEIDQHRWYSSYLYVVDINGMLVGYMWYECIGDVSISDMDLEFNFDFVAEYEPFERTIVDYRRVNK